MGSLGFLRTTSFVAYLVFPDEKDDDTGKCRPLFGFDGESMLSSVANDISSVINIYREEKHANRAPPCQKFDQGRIPPFLHLLVLLPIQPLKKSCISSSDVLS
jgi:hypothetical protein